MVDEPEDVLIETGGEETVEEPQEPEQTPEDSAPESDTEEGQSVADEGTDESEIKSERGQKRVQQLANERNSLKEENQTLRQTLREEPGAASPQQITPPWAQRQEFENLAGQELTPEQYEQHLTAKAHEIARLETERLRREWEFKSNLEQDISHLEKSYPELSGEIQDSSLRQAINKARDNFKIAQRADPNVRLRDFIEPLMQVRQGAEQVGRANASARLQEQADSSAPKTERTTAPRATSEEELMRQIDSGEITLAEAEERIAKLQG